jgi:hypothetical protein
VRWGQSKIFRCYTCSNTNSHWFECNRKNLCRRWYNGFPASFFLRRRYNMFYPISLSTITNTPRSSIESPYQILESMYSVPEVISASWSSCIAIVGRKMICWAWHPGPTTSLAKLPWVAVCRPGPRSSNSLTRLPPPPSLISTTTKIIIAPNGS